MEKKGEEEHKRKKKKKRTEGEKKQQAKGRKMMGTDDPYYPIRPVACPPCKMEKSTSSGHHGPNVVSPTVRGGLLRASVKGLDYGDPPLFLIFIFYLGTLSLYIPLSLFKPSIIRLSFSPSFLPIFTQNLPFSLNLSLSPTNFISFQHFFSKFI